MAHKKNIRITEGIVYSKTRKKTVCSWCMKDIEIGKETIMFPPMYKTGWISPNPPYYQKGSGGRIHLECLKEMCNELKLAAENKGKYAILNQLEN